MASNEAQTPSDAIHGLAVAFAKQLDPLGEGEVPWKPEGVALVLLASPEMEAIKAHLAQQAEYADGGCYGAEWLRRVAKLPDVVIEWVLA